ncbi:MULTISPECIES: tRNA (adenosine(37)-N6)-threonylcarbamoyltransferase complex dimerization subunit type 1 TsaB [unclassified Oleiphilus]|jgi:tRNA threonylcarbamoyladenosine biosynthesis protein TsaB|nr:MULTISPECIES: tRNA (adenosine(37)-N6)-threonylcarbamoyltransferase complex dimerization subunit type 1 TsaB [unclassified Oleiphilus]KZY74385.1 hypothetical protein A3740_16670 [Oleiphilus sp. HI0068]KZY77339.1 hypothetical protein A3741_09865 [Oleiphilus sp. HI0069]KZY87791.1 hypothetical protein A3743_01850 [Oleiphilus sp. HI0072]KZZ20060.1 hypothetical protein A3749_00365 [Oleiphilus sp. HI0078]KZZ37318.1 hypothetical protein A3755_05505 [Oleiphilus sp. HI0085]
MPKILALDTSSDNCSAALWSEQTMYQVCEKAPRSHTQLILPMVKDCLGHGKLKAKNLDALAFGCGPGSFTGIRIATGIAQGLAYGSDCHIYAISNIQALALQSYLKYGISQVLVAIDARMDEVYWACCKVEKQSNGNEDPYYRVETLGIENVTKPELVSLPDAITDGPIIGVGSGFDYSERFPSDVKGHLDSFDAEMRPEAHAICQLARYAHFKGVAGLLEDAMPSYVRNTVTWKKLPGRA